MIILENRFILKDKLLKLKNEIEKADEVKEDTFDFNCLSLWNIFQNYMLNILQEFPIYQGKNIIQENIEIFDFLKIDEFNVTAKGDFDKQKEQIFNYINSLLIELKM